MLLENTPKAKAKAQATDQKPSWEERVVSLELQARDRESHVSAQAATIVSQTAKIEGLTATVTALNAADEARKTAEASAYMASIKARACELGSPIDADDLAQVQAQFDSGNPDLAKVLGGAFLGKAEALGAGDTGSTIQTVTLGATDETNKQIDASLERARARAGLAPKEA